MSSHRRSVRTADGRKIEVLTAGNPHGYPWLWIPGSPSAAAHYPRLDDLAARLDLRIVTWSRPLPSRSVGTSWGYLMLPILWAMDEGERQ